LYNVDDEGDIVVVGGSYGSDATPIHFYEYSPSWKLLDYPLLLGRSWSSESRYSPSFPICDSSECDLLTVTVTVMGEEVVATPFGDLPVVVVAVSETSVGYAPYEREYTLKLHVNLGPVDGLVSYSGIVGNESCTWSHIKALYR